MNGITGGVLVVGSYITDRPSAIVGIVQGFASSRRWRVVQRWVGHGKGHPPPEVAGCTVFTLQSLSTKFALVNELVAAENLDDFDYVIISDDDVTFAEGFLDHYLALVEKYDFALAQPARTSNSWIDHNFVERLNGIVARQTQFVEIGPVFSIRRDLYTTFFPFDTSTPMGWGYDFVWPRIIQDRGLRMGIVDATPVDHSMRKPVGTYAYEVAAGAMEEYLATHDHLGKSECFRILESYTEDVAASS